MELNRMKRLITEALYVPHVKWISRAANTSNYWPPQTQAITGPFSVLATIFHYNYW